MTDLANPPPPAAPTALRPAVANLPLYPFVPQTARVKLDQNEASADFPAALKTLALARLAEAEWHRYPDLHANRLRAAIAAAQGWPVEGVVVTPGSNVLIHALTSAAGLGQRVLSLAPAFALYALEAKMLAASLTELPLLEGFALPMPALLQELAAGGPGILFLAEPHAPTGTFHDVKQLETLIEAAGPGWLVVIDEAYAEFAGRDHKKLVQQHSNVVILRTFSKALGLAGARLGYLLAQPALAQNIQKLISPFNVSVLAQVVGEVALEHPEYVAERVAQTISERERVYQALKQHPSWVVFPSRANYLLIHTPDAARVHRELLARGVLIRRQDGYVGLSGCVRVSIGTVADNDAFLTAAMELR
jgi:histidinol-phosphate aminotransferase